MLFVAVCFSILAASETLVLSSNVTDASMPIRTAIVFATMAASIQTVMLLEPGINDDRFVYFLCNREAINRKRQRNVGLISALIILASNVVFFGIVYPWLGRYGLGLPWAIATLGIGFFGPPFVLGQILSGWLKRRR